MVIMNEECDFVVKNYKAIDALIECRERAKVLVPRWLSNKLASKIRERLDELPQDTMWKIESLENNGVFEVAIYPQIAYTQEGNLGVYYGIEGLTWDEIASQIEEDGCWIFLYYEADKIPKGATPLINRWKNDLEERIAVEEVTLTKRELLVKPRTEDRQYLIARYALDHLNLKKLGEHPAGCIDETVSAIIDFIKLTRQLLAPLPI